MGYPKEIYSVVTQKWLVSTALQENPPRKGRKKTDSDEHVSMMGIEVNMQDLFNRFTFDNICMFVLCTDPGMLCIDFHEESYVATFEEVD